MPCKIVTQVNPIGRSLMIMIVIFQIHITIRLKLIYQGPFPGKNFLLIWMFWILCNEFVRHTLFATLKSDIVKALIILLDASSKS